MNKAAKLIIATVLATFSASVFAFPSTTLEGDGVLWTLSGSTVDNTGSFTLSADVSGADSLLDDAYLHEFSLKNFGSSADMTNLSLVDWESRNDGLNANGCKSKGTSDALCAYNATSDFMNGPSSASDFSITFDIALAAGDLFPDLTHFKLRWVKGDGEGGYNKVGDLISEDFGGGCDGDCGDVPEPGMLGLLAIGLLGMVAARRRKNV